MGFLDATGVTTLVTKLREKFAPSQHTHSFSDITSGNIDVSLLPSASTSQKGIVQLNSTTTSSSTTLAATPSAVYTAWGKSMYGTSSTGATTAAKTATCANYSLVTGQIVTVQFSNANTYVSGALSLNVNSKGAKTIYKNGSATSASNTLLWDSGDVLQFVYDGSYYRFITKSSAIVPQFSTVSQTASQVSIAAGATSWVTVPLPSGKTALAVSGYYLNGGAACSVYNITMDSSGAQLALRNNGTASASVTVTAYYLCVS